MSEQKPPYYNSEADWQLRPQANFSMQPSPYSPSQQMPSYQYPGVVPPQPYPNSSSSASQLPPPHQVSAQPVNINIVNQQNGYMSQAMYDPYSSVAQSALWFGIIAVTIWIIPFVGPLASLICTIIGLINGIRGLRSIMHKGSAISGIILSCIAPACIVLSILIFGATIFSLLSIGHAGSSTVQPPP